MGKREAAREEAAFLRGEVGVDGQAVEAESVDVAEAERGKAREQYLRGRAYLGREFLTWLLYRSESGDPLLTHGQHPVTVLFFDRLVLRGIAGEVTELSARGAMAPYSPLVRSAIKRGLLPHAARLRVTHGDRIFELGLDAEYLDVRSAKLPELLTEQEDEQLLERLELAGQLSSLLQALLEAFLAVRTTPNWSKKVVPLIAAWLDGES